MVISGVTLLAHNQQLMAAYDKFDYPAYWKGRRYEHNAEVIAIKSLFNIIGERKSIIEIGAGYGRLTPYYLPYIKKAVLTDPSSALLSLAEKNIRSSKIKLIHSSIESLNKKMKTKFDTAIMVRVLHHIENPKNTFRYVYNLLANKGFFILEFPNKLHSKALLKEIMKGNFTVLFDYFPKDIRCKSNIRNKSISFNNYHPTYVLDLLKECGFEIITVKSVSNIRNRFISSHAPLFILNFLEIVFQSLFSHIYFGPSVFVLARKKR